MEQKVLLYLVYAKHEKLIGLGCQRIMLITTCLQALIPLQLRISNPDPDPDADPDSSEGHVNPVKIF